MCTKLHSCPLVFRDLGRDLLPPELGLQAAPSCLLPRSSAPALQSERGHVGVCHTGPASPSTQMAAASQALRGSERESETQTQRRAGLPRCSGTGWMPTGCGHSWPRGPALGSRDGGGAQGCRGRLSREKPPAVAQRAPAFVPLCCEHVTPEE